MNHTHTQDSGDGVGLGWGGSRVAPSSGLCVLNFLDGIERMHKLCYPKLDGCWYGQLIVGAAGGSASASMPS